MMSPEKIKACKEYYKKNSNLKVLITVVDVIARLAEISPYEVCELLEHLNTNNIESFYNDAPTTAHIKNVSDESVRKIIRAFWDVDNDFIPRY